MSALEARLQDLQDKARDPQLPLEKREEAQKALGYLLATAHAAGNVVVREAVQPKVQSGKCAFCPHAEYDLAHDRHGVLIARSWHCAIPNEPCPPEQEHDPRVTAKDYGTMDNRTFAIALCSTNDRAGVEEAMTVVFDKQDAVIEWLSEECRRLCQRDHVCAHRAKYGNCESIMSNCGVDAAGNCNYDDPKMIVELARMAVESRLRG